MCFVLSYIVVNALLRLTRRTSLQEKRSQQLEEQRGCRDQAAAKRMQEEASEMAVAKRHDQEEKQVP
jgi:hypothetical protein